MPLPVVHEVAATKSQKNVPDYRPTRLSSIAVLLRRLFNHLQINGCTDSEISFEQAVVSGYSNANSPTDNSCHVFHVNGGGLRLIEIPESVQTIAAGNTHPKVCRKHCFFKQRKCRIRTLLLCKVAFSTGLHGL